MIRELAKSIREYKKETIITPIFMILEVIMEMLIPYFIADLIDKGVMNGDMSVIIKIGIYLILCAVMSLVFSIIAGIISSKASNGFAKNLRHDIYYRVQNYSFYNIFPFYLNHLNDYIKYQHQLYQHK